MEQANKEERVGCTELLDYLINDRRNTWKRMHFWQKEFIALSGFCVMPHTHTRTHAYMLKFSDFQQQCMHLVHCHTLNTFIHRSLRNDIWLGNVLKRRLSLPNCHTSNVCSSYFPYSLSFSVSVFIFDLSSLSFFLLASLLLVLLLLLLSETSFHFNVSSSSSSSFYVMSHFQS